MVIRQSNVPKDETHTVHLKYGRVSPECAPTFEIQLERSHHVNSAGGGAAAAVAIAGR